MLADKKVQKIYDSLERFKKNYKDGNKRLALGDLDHAKDKIIASIYLLLAEIEEE